MAEYVESMTSADGVKTHEKIKTPFAYIIIEGTAEKPYYNILWHDITKNHSSIGYGSYNLEFVRNWLSEEFEIVVASVGDVAFVAHGRWEECDWVEYDGHGECIHYPNEGLVCTNCRNAFKKELVNNPRVNYCPNCGARMDGE